MDENRKPVQFEEFAAHLDAIFDQVEAQGEGITVERGGKLFALRPKRRRSPRKSYRLTRDDALWDIVGIAASGEPGNTVASNKYAHVADAIASHKLRPSQEQQAREDASPATSSAPPAASETSSDPS
jgi:hypothetical protein